MRESRGNGFENAVSSRGTVGNGCVTVGNGREWFYLRSRGNGCKHFRGLCVCIISLSVRNRVCELTIIDSFLKQYMHIVYWPPLFFNAAWCLTSLYKSLTYLLTYLHISDIRLCILRSERARLHSTGQEWSGTVGYCAGRERFSIWLQLAGTGREWIYLNGTGRDWLWFSFPCPSLTVSKWSKKTRESKTCR